MIPKKIGPDLIRGGCRVSDTIICGSMSIGPWVDVGARLMRDPQRGGGLRVCPNVDLSVCRGACLRTCQRTCPSVRQDARYRAHHSAPQNDCALENLFALLERGARRGARPARGGPCG